jgi:hypothetical protein
LLRALNRSVKLCRAVPTAIMAAGKRAWLKTPARQTRRDAMRT